MCEYCKYSLVYGDNVECLFYHREPTYEEYKNCENYTLHDELEKEYQKFKQEGNYENCNNKIKE